MPGTTMRKPSLAVLFEGGGSVVHGVVPRSILGPDRHSGARTSGVGRRRSELLGVRGLGSAGRRLRNATGRKCCRRCNCNVLLAYGRACRATAHTVSWPMLFRTRQVTADDLDECMAIVRQRPGLDRRYADEQLRKTLLQQWRRLLVQDLSANRIVESPDMPAGHRIVTFGISVFVRPDALDAYSPCADTVSR